MELEVKKSQEVSTYVDYGAGDDITAEDCQIGRIAIMQSGSDLVKSDKAKQGQIINVFDGAVLGYKNEKPFEFIIVGSYKYWLEKEGDKFIGKYPATSPNEKPWEEGNISRMYHHAFLVLSTSDVAEGIALPYELAFRSTDVKVAQKISGFLMKLRSKQLASWTKTFKLTAELKTKDTYKWFGANVEVGREATKEEVQYAKEAREQFNLFKTSAMKKVDTEVVESSSQNIQDAEY